MGDTSQRVLLDQTRILTSDRLHSVSVLRRRLGLFQKLVPAGLMLLVVIYEVGPARWIHDGWGASYHFLAEILIYGAVGPLLAYVLLDLLGRWLEERETSELQAQVLMQAREQARISRELSDDALQALFAASILLTSLKSALPALPPETASELLDTGQALERAIQQLRDHLQAQPPPAFVGRKE